MGGPANFANTSIYHQHAKDWKPKKIHESCKCSNEKVHGFKKQLLDVYVTAVPEFSVAIAIKDTSPLGPHSSLIISENSMMTTITLLSLTNSESLHSWTERYL